MHLNDEELLTAPNKAKSYKIFDGKGLYVEVPVRGHIRWRWKYRFGGKEKKLSLGLYPAISIQKARFKRDQLAKMLENGTDPGVERKETKLMHQIQQENLDAELNTIIEARAITAAKLEEATTYVATLRSVVLSLQEPTFKEQSHYE